jgi:hypothetical protein
MPLWKRVLKVCALLTVTAIISYYFGRLGAIVAFAIAMLPVIYIQGAWRPRHGVNGWAGKTTGEVLRVAGMAISGALIRSTSGIVSRRALLLFFPFAVFTPDRRYSH